MKNKLFTFAIAALALAFYASPVLAMPSQQKILTGKVVSINNFQMKFVVGTGATYTAEIARANLVRKYGTPMQPSEILVGDKVEVKGAVWPDNSMNAEMIRNLSLYAHSGTFTGKITAIDLGASNFTMQTGSNFRTVKTGQYTVIKKNSAAASLGELSVGMKVTVKGQWERTDSVISANSVAATIRLISITVTGRLTMKSPSALTVVGDNNVIYGMNIAGAKLQSKNSKTITLAEMLLGHTIRVTGKHMSESVEIIPSLIKDLSISK